MVGGATAVRMIYFSTILLLTACRGNAASVTDIKAAAAERARERLELSTDTPLASTVWAGGREHEGEQVICGTVSDPAPGSRVRPQRFAATDRPLRWLVFEDAHDPMTVSRGEKFPDWVLYCGEGPEV